MRTAIFLRWFLLFFTQTPMDVLCANGQYYSGPPSYYAVDYSPRTSSSNASDGRNALSDGARTFPNGFQTERVRGRHRRKRIYSDWSDWSPCSEKCSTVRQRHCIRSTVCGSSVVTERSYCLTTSRCPGLAMDRESPAPNKGHAAVNWTCGGASVDPAAAAVPYAFETPRYSVKIMGGRQSEKLRWPWQVAVFNGRKKLVCGGTLVAPGWVLTAAHCTRRKLSVRLNEHDLSVDEGDEFDVGVDRVVVHPEYNPNTIDNDMALLKLRSSDTETNGGYHPQPACLPVSDFHQTKRKPALCVVLGWGKVRSQHSYGSHVLREARVPIVGRRTCRAAYRRYLITENMMCAGYRDGRSDTCAGDSGGPLLCRMRGRWTVVGVTSFGDGCGRRAKYGVYATVANNVRWIVSAITG
ncbi:trypsin-like [Sipha flava]|uniref:Trypsin-like n=1 Tax=Sipha flava TaxID=143950 RepID=A0A8B8FUI7_9HEMI|nr:trypsin-like [Sipha flava]